MATFLFTHRAPACRGCSCSSSSPLFVESCLLVALFLFLIHMRIGHHLGVHSLFFPHLPGEGCWILSELLTTYELALEGQLFCLEALGYHLGGLFRFKHYITYHYIMLFKQSIVLIHSSIYCIVYLLAPQTVGPHYRGLGGCSLLHAFEQSFLHTDGFNRFCTREYLMNTIFCIYIYIYI